MGYRYPFRLASLIGHRGLRSAHPMAGAKIGAGNGKRRPNTKALNNGTTSEQGHPEDDKDEEKRLKDE